MDNALDIADQMNAIADDLLGVARLLFIMYENEVKHGVGAEQFITLYHVVEGYSDDLKTLADRI